MKIPPPIPDGTRFGRLTVIGVSEKKDRHGRVYICRCDCGETRDVFGWQLKRQQSCGCLRREQLYTYFVGSGTTHGMANKHPLYGIWKGMKQRCRDRNHPKYMLWGGRGICVCDRWSGPYGFKYFVEDMGERPGGHSLDRIDVDGNYEPSNCRWATAKEQADNTQAKKRKRLASESG